MVEMEVTLWEKYEVLQGILRNMGSTLVAFSGGIDSTLVLKVAYDTLGSKAAAVTAISPTFPAIELETVRRVSAEIGAPLRLVKTDQLRMDAFVRNDATRCYHCKTDLYELLGQIQQVAGLGTIVDGTNTDDLSDDRPGIQAARGLGVRSPLVEANIGKDEIRSLAKQLGLSNWDKAAAACLSSRIPRGISITRAKLSRVEQAEAMLFQEGVKQVRVRDHEGIARIEVDARELDIFFKRETRTRVVVGLKKLGFQFVTLDLEGYRSGSTNL